MTVQGVGAGVEFGVGKPPVEWGTGVIQNLLWRSSPAYVAGRVAPEGGGVVETRLVDVAVLAHGSITPCGRRANLEDVGKRFPRRWDDLLICDRCLSDPDQELWCAALTGQPADDLSAGCEFGHVGERAGRQAGHGAIEKDCGQRLAAMQDVQPRVFAMGGQDHDLGTVYSEVVTSARVVRGGKATLYINAVGYCGGYQRCPG